MLTCRKIPRSEVKSFLSSVGITVEIGCVLVKSLTTDILPETGHAPPLLLSPSSSRKEASDERSDCQERPQGEGSKDSLVR